MKIPNLTERAIADKTGNATELFWLFLDGLNKWLRGSGITLYATHAQRTAPATRGYVDPANVPDGSILIETDTGLTYQFRNGAWAYLSGTYSRTQAQLSALAATLTAADTGLLVNVTDYAHTLRWTGSAWQWGPAEAGSGMMVLFEVDPTGAGWHLYDGSTVNYLKSDGSTASVTLPNLVGSAVYTKAGSPNSGPNAATAPGFSGGSIANAITGITANTAPTISNQAETATGPSSVSSANHVHNVNITDTGHTHTFSGGAVDATGEPPNLVRRPWFRQ